MDLKLLFLMMLKVGLMNIYPIYSWRTECFLEHNSYIVNICIIVQTCK